MIDHNECDEYLELLYHLRERHEMNIALLAAHDPAFRRDILDKLEELELLVVSGERIELTDEGFARAEQIVRRHRLAERLLADVLHMSPAEVEAGACEFEHMVADEITESICTLLGHPRECPHGSPIPEGDCCRAARQECVSAVVPLTEAPLGATVRIAYITSGGDERQHRLTHLGILPGSLVKLHQRSPCYVVVLDRARIAMESAIARDIFVWKQRCESLNVA